MARKAAIESKEPTVVVSGCSITNTGGFNPESALAILALANAAKANAEAISSIANTITNSQPTLTTGISISTGGGK